MMVKLDDLLKDPKLTAAQKGRIVDILAFSEDKDAGRSVLVLLAGDHPAEVKAKALDNLKAFLPTKWKSLASGREMVVAMDTLLKSQNPAQRLTGLQLVAAAKDKDRLGDVRRLTAQAARGPGEPDEVVLEGLRTLGQLRDAQSIAILQMNLMRGGPRAGEFQAAAIRSLGTLIEPQAKDEISNLAMKPLQYIVQNTEKMHTEANQRLAIDELAGVNAGANWLIKLKEDGKFPAGLASSAGILLRNSPFRGVSEKAKSLFPLAAKLDLNALPGPAALARIGGDAGRGRAVMLASLKGDAQCMKCHKVKGEGGEIGPDLSVIGKKASKENLFESLLNPSKAIADQYVTWKVETEDGHSVTGLLVKETPSEWTIRDANGKDTVISVKGATRSKSPQSLMPDDIVKTLSEQELIDLVEYLLSLKE
jgi:putative heme-binding domain-containing protein